MVGTRVATSLGASVREFAFPVTDNDRETASLVPPPLDIYRRCHCLNYVRTTGQLDRSIDIPARSRNVIVALSRPNENGLSSDRLTFDGSFAVRGAASASLPAHVPKRYRPSPTRSNRVHVGTASTREALCGNDDDDDDDGVVWKLVHRGGTSFSAGCPVEVRLDNGASVSLMHRATLFYNYTCLAETLCLFFLRQ